jgi:site-specific recombinase XerD
VPQNTTQNVDEGWRLLRTGPADGLAWWAEHYFRLAVTTTPASQQVQHRDLALFLRYMRGEEGSDLRMAWTPRLSRAFHHYLQHTLDEEGYRHWSDATIIRILAHLKTFASWIHTLRPFPLGHPMAHLKLPVLGSRLQVERALTLAERRRLLDAADLLLAIGGRSKDRKRYRTGERPVRKGYRPYRNRAIVYTLIETGMRRAAVTKLDVESLDEGHRLLTVAEKGGYTHTYAISREGWDAIHEYLTHERDRDVAHWQSPALFLAASTVACGTGRLAALAINDIWQTVCRTAGVRGKTPHSARHAMGQHIMAKTGNIAAVQRQLGHRHAVYAMQYARVSREQLGHVLDDR